MTAVAGCQWRQSPINAGRKYNLPHLHLAPPLGVTPVEFHRDLRCQNTRVHGLSCGVVLHLAVWVCIEHRLVTDRQTHDYGIYHDSMASRGKKTYVQASRNLLYMLTMAAQYVMYFRFYGLPGHAGRPVTPRAGECPRLPRALFKHYALFARGRRVHLPWRGVRGAKSEIRIALFIFRFSSTDIAYPKLHLYPKSTSVQHF